MEFVPNARLGRAASAGKHAKQPRLVLDGRVEIVVDGHRYEFGQCGDVLVCPGNTPHSYRNPDTRLPARGISVVILAKAGV